MRSAGAGLAIVAVAGVLAGCDVGRPSGFAAAANSTCRQAAREIGKLAAPTDPAAGLRYALDRYVIMERTVATFTDGSLPGGETGRQLRDEWLQPARASLRAGRDDLGRLRDALRAGQAAAAQTAFDAAARAGTLGVDPGVLSGRGVDDCAGLFTPDVPAPAWT